MIKIQFLSHHRKARVAPDPKFPNGIDINLAGEAGKTCQVTLPYPAPECGVWILNCEDCGYRAAITTAGRTDDPRSAKVPCASN
jgi:hypothetical protein